MMSHEPHFEPHPNWWLAAYTRGLTETITDCKRQQWRGFGGLWQTRVNCDKPTATTLLRARSQVQLLSSAPDSTRVAAKSAARRKQQATLQATP